MDWFTETVTVFNRVMNLNTEEVTWHPTVFKNVRVIKNKGQMMNKTGNTNTDKCRLHIKLKYLPNKRVVDSICYENLSPEEAEKCVTFGGEYTFFVLGDVSNVQTLPTGFFEHMKKHFPDVYKTTNEDLYGHVLPHIEIGGV